MRGHAVACVRVASYLCRVQRVIEVRDVADRGTLRLLKQIRRDVYTGLRPVLGTFDPHPAAPGLDRLRRTSTGYAGPRGASHGSR